MIASQLSRYCDIIKNRLWRHQQNEDRASETRGRSSFLSPFMDSLCRVRNKIMYVLSWRAVSAPTRVLFLCLFPSSLRGSRNENKNNPLVSAETIRHTSTYIILYVPCECWRPSNIRANNIWTHRECHVLVNMRRHSIWLHEKEQYMSYILWCYDICNNFLTPWIGNNMAVLMEIFSNTFSWLNIFI